MPQPQYALPEGATIVHLPTETIAAPTPGAMAPAAPADDGSQVGEMPDVAPTPLPADAPPEQAPPTFMGVPPAKDGKELHQGLDTLVALRAPPETVQGYIDASGYQFHGKDQKWITETYPAYLKSLPKDPKATKAHVDWTVNSPDTKPEVGTGSAVFSGLKAGALMGFDDELQAGAGAVGNKIGNWLGLNATDASMGDVYDQILAKTRAAKDEAYRQHPLAYGAGYVPGAIISSPVIGGKLTAGESLVGRVVNAAHSAGKAGAITAAGNNEGSLTDKVQSMPGGYATAAPVGVVTYPLGVGVNSVASRLKVRLTPKPAETSGLDVLQTRAPQDPAAMRQRSQDFNEAGVPPRLVDVVDESGHGVIRDAAGQMTPGRQAVTEHADQVYTDTQSRVANQARTHISDRPGTASGVADAVKADREVSIGDAMKPIRGDVVPITPDIANVLATREGQAALRTAEGLMTDHGDRALARQLLGAARKAAKGPADPEDAFRAEVKGWDELPQPVKDAYKAQRPDLLEQADPFADVHLTVDMADKFARAMKGRGSSNPGLERVATQFSNAVRGEARAGSSQYDKAMTDYADSSKVMNAAAGEGPHKGVNFMSDATTPEDFAASVNSAGKTVPDGAPMSEADAIRMRSRDEVVSAATGSAGQNAPRTARQLARGGTQRAKNEALLGPDGARAMEKSMGKEVKRYDNTRYVDPRTGSQTAGREHDAIVDGAADAMINAKSGGTWAVVKTAGQWLRRGGIRNVDAERLSRQAISSDPTELEKAINYLEQKGMKQERARQFMSNFTSALSGAATNNERNKPQPPQNSVDAVVRSGAQ